MLFPHLFLFPYQPAYDSASSASKLYKTQGKLPQRDTTLLFPLLLLPLPRRLLFSPFSACDKSKCVPQHWLHVVGVQLKTNSMSSTGRFMSILQCEKKCSTSPFLHYMARKKRENMVFYQRTQMAIWTFQPFFFYHNLFFFFWFRKLICTKTYGLPSSGLKATLVGHQVWFSTSDIFLGGEMAWNWIL